jgi:hypothetical protein
MLLSVESHFVGAFALQKPKATLLHRNGLVQAGLPASLEHVQTDNRDSPGTWEILSPPRHYPGWRYRVTNSRPRRCTRPLGSEMWECNRGTAKR